MKTRILLFLITLLCAAIASVQSANAAILMPTVFTDGVAGGTLREVLTEQATDGDTIVLNSGQYDLTLGELEVNASVTIVGPGADMVAVDGNHNSRVFYISPGHTVSISGLTIRNGNGVCSLTPGVEWCAPAPAGDGVGGAIYNDHSMLTISNCTVSDNSAGNGGGGIFNDGASGSAMLTISDSTLSGNLAHNGGGILSYGFNGGATMTISNSTLSGNSADGGGGILNNGFNGSVTATISNSTLSGNSASVLGGGIWNDGQAASGSGSATMTISNSTVSSNSAGNGGGIFNDALVDESGSGNATMTISNSTLSGNSASVHGGGIYNRGEASGSATLTVGDTILHAGASGENIYNSFGTASSGGYNLSNDDGGGFLTAMGDQINTDPMLSPLQDNGGPTFTHALLPGSPAIDMGDPNFTPPPDYDQRGPGFPRVANGRIDIGAFEVQTIVCPQPQGYWKSNPDVWPVTELMLGTHNHSQIELLNILNTPKHGDASLILASQLIAAKLNIFNGADPTPVQDTIDDADNLLDGCIPPCDVKTNTIAGQQMVNDATTLESYNNGLLTPGCTPTPTPTPTP
jgi:hypothetical protein